MEITAIQVKKQLDEILAREIISFVDVDFDAAMMSFNLATISCVTLIVEREKEIKQYQDFPPERYVLDSFYSELADIGLEQDEYLEQAVSSSFDKGYMRKDDDGELHAEMPAFMMAGLLDSMFPGMQGMNLIAFVLQMNDEVNAGRKSLDLAKKSFEASLKSRGVAVTRDNAQKRATDIVSGSVKNVTQTREVSKKLKKENLDRLSKLVKSRRKRTADYQEKVRVTDVFDKGPSKEEIEAQKEAIRKTEEAARRAAVLAKQLAEKEEKIREAEEAAKEAADQLKALEDKEAELKAAWDAAAKAEERAAELEAREALMAEKEAKLKAMEERIRLEEERMRQEQETAAAPAAEPEILEDDDIESRIAAFESELTMPCPLCKEGEIVSNTTGKGKDYFSCTKPDCRFVSWDKPYHFPCPLCRNPFLTEIDLPTGEKGLKCPRAACSYHQTNLLDPKLNMASTAEAAAAPKKKRKVVRRKKRR